MRITLPLVGVLCVFSVLLCAGASPAGAEDRPFVQQLYSQPTSLDPGKTGLINDDHVITYLYDGLTHLSADGQHSQPALARKWDVSLDGLTSTFHLRDGVRFHDGSLLDAEAVKLSYERQYNPTSPYYSATPPNPFEKVLSGFIKEIRLPDPRTVVITTFYARPQQFALVKIVSPRAVAAANGDLSRNPSGTGPFKLDRWDRDALTLTAFPGGWAGAPQIKSIRFNVQPSSQALDALLAGESDYFIDVPPDYFEQLQSTKRYRLVRYGGLNTYFIGLVATRPTLTDRRVREAIIRAVNRERMAAVLGRGAFVPAKGLLPPACLGYSPETVQAAYDPGRAKQLLADANASTLHLKILYFSPLENWSEYLLAVKADLDKVGISLELVRAKDWQDFLEQRKKGEHDLFLYRWAVSAPDPERFLFPLFYSQSPDNFTGYASPEVDAFLADARKPLSEARRLQLYAAAHRRVVQDAPALFLAHQVGMAAVHTRVKGMTLNLQGRPQDKLVHTKLD